MEQETSTSSSGNIEIEEPTIEVSQPTSITPDSIRGALIDLIDCPPCP